MIESDNICYIYSSKKYIKFMDPTKAEIDSFVDITTVFISMKEYDDLKGKISQQCDVIKELQKKISDLRFQKSKENLLSQKIMHQDRSRENQQAQQQLILKRKMSDCMVQKERLYHQIDQLKVELDQQIETKDKYEKSFSIANSKIIKLQDRITELIKEAADSDEIIRSSCDQIQTYIKQQMSLKRQLTAQSEQLKENTFKIEHLEVQMQLANQKFSQFSKINPIKQFQVSTYQRILEGEESQQLQKIDKFQEIYKLKQHLEGQIFLLKKQLVQIQEEHQRTVQQLKNYANNNQQLTKQISRNEQEIYQFQETINRYKKAFDKNNEEASKLLNECKEQKQIIKEWEQRYNSQRADFNQMSEKINSQTSLRESNYQKQITDLRNLEQKMNEDYTLKENAFKKQIADLQKKYEVKKKELNKIGDEKQVLEGERDNFRSRWKTAQLELLDKEKEFNELMTDYRNSQDKVDQLKDLLQSQ